MSEFGPKFDRLERAWESQEPPEEHDCAEDGHVWRKIRIAPTHILGVEALDEATLYRCTKCGKEEVQ